MTSISAQVGHTFHEFNNFHKMLYISFINILEQCKRWSIQSFSILDTDKIYHFLACQRIDNSRSFIKFHACVHDFCEFPPLHYLSPSSVVWISEWGGDNGTGPPATRAEDRSSSWTHTYSFPDRWASKRNAARQPVISWILPGARLASPPINITDDSTSNATLRRRTCRFVPDRLRIRLLALNAQPVCIVLNRLGMKVLRGSARELKHKRRAVRGDSFWCTAFEMYSFSRFHVILDNLNCYFLLFSFSS